MYVVALEYKKFEIMEIMIEQEWCMARKYEIDQNSVWNIPLPEKFHEYNGVSK